MKVKILPALLLSLLAANACGHKQNNQPPQAAQQHSAIPQQQEQEPTIAKRFPAPQGFKRTALVANSFGHYLRNFQLKPRNAKVHLYNGEEKRNQNAHAAVLDIDAGNKDLQQCADAVMRLRAEYFYTAAQPDSIHFNFTNGFRAGYSKWRQGYRINVSGNNASWVKTAAAADDRKTFQAYLEKVFSFAGTLSLSKELKSIACKDLQPGDVFIKGGSPGHAVIVMDVAVNDAGKKIYMLAQSYMPAQEIHLLKNPTDPALSPWYALDENDNVIQTPEWTFYSNELKRF